MDEDTRCLRLPDGAEGKDECRDQEMADGTDSEGAGGDLPDPPSLQVGYHHVRQTLQGQYSQDGVFVLLEKAGEEEEEQEEGDRGS